MSFISRILGDFDLLPGTTHAEDLEAEQVSGVHVLLDRDDEAEVRRKVSRGGLGDMFMVEPGASWTLSDTLQIGSSTIVGSSPRSNQSTATFIKGFDGDLATWGDFAKVVGVDFDGAGDTYTGHGIVDEETNVRETVLRDCKITSCEGSGLHHAIHYLSTYDTVRIQGCRDGVRFYDSSNHIGQNLWQNVYVNNNDGHGFRYETQCRDSQWVRCSIVKNGGAGVYFNTPDSCYPNMDTGTHITGNDEPGVLADGRLFGVCNARFTDNLNDQTMALTTPVGESIHTEDRFEGLVVGSPTAIGSPALSSPNASSALGDLTVTGRTGDIDVPETFVVVINDSQVGTVSTTRSGIGLDPTSGGSTVSY